MLERLRYRVATLAIRHGKQREYSRFWWSIWRILRALTNSTDHTLQ